MHYTPILEDFRFATAVQVQHYDEGELQEKPHLPGYAFTQLLDQLGEHAVRLHSRGLRLNVFVQAPLGTLSWITHFLGTYDQSNELVLRVDGEVRDQAALQALRRKSHVLDLHELSRDAQRVYRYLQLINCIVLAPTSDLRYWYKRLHWRKPNSLQRLIAYDPTGVLRDQDGEYFLNSEIWIQHGH